MDLSLQERSPPGGYGPLDQDQESTSTVMSFHISFQKKGWAIRGVANCQLQKCPGQKRNMWGFLSRKTIKNHGTSRSWAGLLKKNSPPRAQLPLKCSRGAFLWLFNHFRRPSLGSQPSIQSSNKDWDIRGFFNHAVKTRRYICRSKWKLNSGGAKTAVTQTTIRRADIGGVFIAIISPVSLVCLTFSTKISVLGMCSL